MQPDVMSLEQAREFLKQHFGRPVEEVDTEELESLCEQVHEESKQTPYTGEQEALLQALNLELSTRSGQ